MSAQDYSDSQLAAALIGTWQFSRTPRQTNRIVFSSNGSYVEHTAPESIFTRVGITLYGDKAEGTWSIKERTLFMFTRNTNSIFNLPLLGSMKLPLGDLIARGSDILVPDKGAIIAISGKAMVIDFLGERATWTKIE